MVDKFLEQELIFCTVGMWIAALGLRPAHLYSALFSFILRSVFPFHRRYKEVNHTKNFNDDNMTWSVKFFLLKERLKSKFRKKIYIKLVKWKFQTKGWQICMNESSKTTKLNLILLKQINKSVWKIFTLAL